MTDQISTPTDSPWPHRWAVVMVCATFPLIWVGGLVTTYDAGMAVEDWPSTRGYNLFLYPWTTWVFGPFDIFIEHGHRLLGAAVGVIAICFVGSVFLSETRRWMRPVAIVGLLLVIAQGLLGGARVLLDQRTLAMIHGCVGPLFFAYSVTLAVMTSQLWRHAPRSQVPTAGALHRLSISTSILIYVQLVVGAQLRHVPVTATPSHFRLIVFFHLLTAALVTLQVLALAWLVYSKHREQSALTRPALALCLLLLVQLGLGAGTWVVKYSWPSWAQGYAWTSGLTLQANSMLQALTTTAHVATGSLLLVISLMLALRGLRVLRVQDKPAASKKFVAGLVA